MHIERKARLCETGYPVLASGLQLKNIAADGTFAGYASVFDVIDNQKDIVLPGAFKKSLLNRERDIKLLWQHQFAEPIGVVERLFEDRRGLYIEGRLLLEVAKAREVHVLLKSGAIKGMSIGYTPVKYSYDPDNGVRMLSQVDLWEISLVTFPANEAALVTVVKSDDVAMHHSMPCLQEWETAKQSGELIRLTEAFDYAIGALR